MGKFSNKNLPSFLKKPNYYSEDEQFDNEAGRNPEVTEDCETCGQEPQIAENKVLRFADFLNEKKQLNAGLQAYLAKKAGKKPAGKKAAPGKSGKPDFLDLDLDGDKKESMKKAATDAKSGAPKKKTVAIKEGAMSEIDLLAQESKTFRSFVRAFKKEYSNLDAGDKTELESWLQTVYDAAKSRTNESWDPSDAYEGGASSNCCGASVMMGDICSDCGEHCEAEYWDEEGSGYSYGEYKEGPGASEKEIQGNIDHYKKNPLVWKMQAKKDFEAMAAGESADIKDEHYPEWKKEDFIKVLTALSESPNMSEAEYWDEEGDGENPEELGHNSNKFEYGIGKDRLVMPNGRIMNTPGNSEYMAEGMGHTCHDGSKSMLSEAAHHLIESICESTCSDASMYEADSDPEHQFEGYVNEACAYMEKCMYEMVDDGITINEYANTESACYESTCESIYEVCEKLCNEALEIHNDDSTIDYNDYVKEALGCYRNGLMESAVYESVSAEVMTKVTQWLANADNQLRSLTMSPDQQASEIGVTLEEYKEAVDSIKTEL